jgi:hypothetical protein
MFRFLLTISLVVTLWDPASAGFREGLVAYYRLDYETALEQWLPLAERGDPRAQYQLAVLYYRGDGVEQDYGEAAKWFRRAAERGDADAQFNLAMLYADGKGMPRNLVRARMWFALAAEAYETRRDQDWAVANRSLAARKRDWTATQLSAAEVAKADRMAGRWKPKP